MRGFKLNEDQEEAVYLSLLWLFEEPSFEGSYEETHLKKIGKTPKDDYFVISGPGGSGKSTIANDIALEYAKVRQMNRTRVMAACLAHEAKGQLQDKLDFDVITLASLLGKEPKTVKGKTEFVINPKKIKPIESLSLLIVDECSQITVEDIGHINNLKPDDCKVILLGDIYQLPPIEQRTDPNATSVVFNIQGVQLEKVERYSGDISLVGQHLRDCQDTDSLFTLPVLKDDSVLVMNWFKRFKELAIEGKLVDPSTFRVVAYKNATVYHMNTKIREYLGYVKEWEEEDWMTLSDNYGELHNGYKSVVEDAEYEGVGGLGIWRLEDGENTFYTLSQSSRGEYGNLLKEVASRYSDDKYASMSGLSVLVEDVVHHVSINSAQADKTIKNLNRSRWGWYWYLKSLFAKVDYAYATTCYKVQGSTIENVIVDVTDIQSLKVLTNIQQLRALYTACTRPSKSLTLHI